MLDLYLFLQIRIEVEPDLRLPVKPVNVVVEAVVILKIGCERVDIVLVVESSEDQVLIGVFRAVEIDGGILAEKLNIRVIAESVQQVLPIVVRDLLDDRCGFGVELLSGMKGSLRRGAAQDDGGIHPCHRGEHPELDVRIVRENVVPVDPAGRIGGGEVVGLGRCELDLDVLALVVDNYGLRGFLLRGFRDFLF